MQLSSETEEVATFYAKMLEHDYTSKVVFNTNFFKDWRKVCTLNRLSNIKSSKATIKSTPYTQTSQLFIPFIPMPKHPILWQFGSLKRTTCHFRQRFLSLEGCFRLIKGSSLCLA